MKRANRLFLLMTSVLVAGWIALPLQSQKIHAADGKWVRTTNDSVPASLVTNAEVADNVVAESVSDKDSYLTDGATDSSAAALQSAEIPATAITLASPTPDALVAASALAAASGDYLAASLLEYNIPAEVIQVLLANSTYANGETPSERGQTPETFTIADVKQLTTVSLADRTANADGSFSSTPNQTVATWVAGCKAGVDYNIQDGAFYRNTTALVEGENGSLATKEIEIYGAKATLSFNFLMQIIASAEKAAIVDLTGVTSKIADNSLALQLLCLFQTERLPALQSLILAQNNLQSISFQPSKTTLFNTSDTQKITSLDLSNNNMDFKTGNYDISEFPILKNLTNLDLGGNDVTLVQGWLARALEKIVENEGSSDLSDADLNTEDWTTITTILTVINSNSAEIELSDTTVNNIFTANVSQEHLPNKDAIEKYLNQLTNATIDSLLTNNENVKNDPDLKQLLEDKAAGKDPQPSTNAIAVTGDLAFETVSLDQIDKSLELKENSNGLTLEATLEPGSQLFVKMSAWQSGTDQSTFDSELILPKVDSYWPTTSVTATPEKLVANDSDKLMTFEQNVTGATLTIPETERNKINAQAYTATITWTISTIPDSAS